MAYASLSLCVSLDVHGYKQLVPACENFCFNGHLKVLTSDMVYLDIMTLDSTQKSCYAEILIRALIGCEPLQLSWSLM